MFLYIYFIAGSASPETLKVNKDLSHRVKLLVVLSRVNLLLNSESPFGTIKYAFGSYYWLFLFILTP